MDPLAFVLIVLLIAAYVTPSIVALYRDHGYKWVIVGLNIIGGITVVGWIVAMIWAVWPNDRSLADPVLGNPTGKGSRNVGDTVGAVTFGTERGFEEEKAAYEAKKQRNQTR